jgi:cleavage and polyadenylation specificity factor subunit 3
MSTGPAANNQKLFDEEELHSSFASIQPVSFHEEVHVPARPSTSTTPTSTTSIKFTSYPAGHILGACMFHIEIGGARVLYTGDYSTEEDRHLIPASVPSGGWGSGGVRPDVMICESTFGVQTLEPRLDKEERLTGTAIVAPLTALC